MLLLLLFCVVDFVIGNVLYLNFVTVVTFAVGLWLRIYSLNVNCICEICADSVNC